MIARRIVAAGHAFLFFKVAAAAAALDLNGGVLDAVSGAHGVNVPQRLLRISAVAGSSRQKAVHAESRHAVADAPDVQIVYATDRLNGADGAVHLVPADVRRNLLQQYGYAAADDGQCGIKDERAERQCRDWVDPVPGGIDPDDEAGD